MKKSIAKLATSRVGAKVENHLVDNVDNIIGYIGSYNPIAGKVAQGVHGLAMRQGGDSMIENYQLLSKRAGMVAGGVAAVVTIGSVASGIAVRRHIRQARKERKHERAEKRAAFVKSAASAAASACKNVPGAVSTMVENGRDLGQQAVGLVSSLPHPSLPTLPISQKFDKDSAGIRQDYPENLTETYQEFDETVPSPTLYLRYGKRACDLAVGIVSLPIVGIVIAGSGLAIWLEDRGPIFYNAPRVGLDGQDFIMFKLRSMRVDAPDLVMEDGSTYNGADDPRMTRVGAFLRRTSLDEIPQFINVLRGEMSVVGPRPDLRREVELYRDDEPLKLRVKPGVTGYAAVYGRNSLPWHDRLALDVDYVRNVSFALDAKIFLRTFVTVVRQDGIFVEE